MNLRLFDCTGGFGLYRTRVFRFARTAEELIQEMDFCGIDQALVYHTGQRFDLPNAGNEILMSEVEGYPRLVPTWAVLPSHTGEQPPVTVVLETIRERGIRALRLFPEDHRYFLDDVTWGDQLEVYQERRIPIFIRANLEKIKGLLRAFPNLVVVTGAQGSNPQDRYGWPLIERYPNLYFETSGYLADGIIEALCQRYGANRLLFASGYPDNASGAAQLRLAHAEISDIDRQAIACDNLSRLLAEAIIQ
jgi:predicted TIM-barrel fold metal-dependent hydrolase